MGTTLVLGLLAVMCGCIAYVGDVLGRRMGKKRLSLFGLRPRHTAVVFTVVTGVMIAAITLGALLLASAGVRVAVTRGEQLLQENRRLSIERRDLFKTYRRTTDKNEALEVENGQLAKGNQTLRQVADRLRSETGRLQQQNGRLQEKNHWLDRQREQLAGRNEQLQTENGLLVSGNRELHGKNSQLAHTNGRLSQTNRTLLTSSQTLKARNRGLQREISVLESARAKAQGDLTTARLDLVQVESRALQVLKGLQQSTDRARDRTAELESGHVVVRAREELARHVVPAGGSPDNIRRAIASLVQAANREVEQREGMTQPRRGSDTARRHVQLIGTRSMQEVPDYLIERLISESHAIAGLKPELAMREVHALVIRAVAQTNLAAGSTDPVDVAIDARANLLAFRRGEEIAVTEMATAGTAGHVLKSLVAFLQREVRDAALKRSVLPDATGRVGEIDYEALLDVVARIRQLPGRARVGAVSAQDAWSAGPMRLDFYVVPTDTQVAKKEKEREE